MSKIRCFVGFFVPEYLRRGIFKVQDLISKLPASCKMVEAENLHVNLSFLGDVDESNVPSISKMLAEISSHYSCFEVEIGKIKLIPNQSYVRVVVLDIIDNSGGLGKMSSEITEKIGGSSKPPHITLCRVRNVLEKNGFVRGVGELKFNAGVRFAVDSISLIKSELAREGPSYSVLKEFTLSGG